MPDLGNTTVFSQTDASNNSGTAPSWSGSAAPSTLDDAGRALQGAVTREWNWRNYTLTAGGTADVKTLTYSVAPAAYYNGQRFAFIANTTNTGSATLNVNSAGAKTIKSMLTGTLANLGAGDMVSGMYVEVAYNTANDCFVWVNQTSALPQALDTTDSPQFTGIELGHASDTTLARASAGVVSVEGNHVPSPASQAQGDILYHNGTTWARLGAGTDGQYLKTQGPAANPTWATVSSGGAVILGDISTASGTSASLGSLTLTDYKVIELWLYGVSSDNAAGTVMLGNSTSDDVAITPVLSHVNNSFTGVVKIDLADGKGVSVIGQGTSWSGMTFDSALSTSTTTISIAMSSFNFDAGSIRVVGYK